MEFSGLKEGVELGDNISAVDNIFVSGEGDPAIGLRTMLDTADFQT